MRSRAVSFPALCSRSRRSSPPPASASTDNLRSSSMRLRCLACELGAAFFFSGKRTSRECFLLAEDTNREMSRQPDGPEEEHYSQEHLRAHSYCPLRRRSNGGDVDGGLHQDKHGAQAHGHDQDSGENRSKNHFHGIGFASGVTRTRITQLEV